MKVILWLALLLALSVGVWYVWSDRLNNMPDEEPIRVNERATNTRSDTDTNGTSSPGVSVGSSSAPSLGGNESTTLSIAMLDYEGTSNGPMRGCDKLVFVEEVVPKTSIPLTVALQTLFSYTGSEVKGHDNFIASVRDTLSFERAEVVNGTAKIYLTGALTGLGGVCDDPRAKIQIEETALRFETVDRVELYLNGVKTNLQPNEQGV